MYDFVICGDDHTLGITRVRCDQRGDSVVGGFAGFTIDDADAADGFLGATSYLRIAIEHHVEFVDVISPGQPFGAVADKSSTSPVESVRKVSTESWDAVYYVVSVKKDYVF